MDGGVNWSMLVEGSRKRIYVLFATKWQLSEEGSYDMGKEASGLEWIARYCFGAYITCILNGGLI